MLGEPFVELFVDDSPLSRGLLLASKKLEAWGKATVLAGAAVLALGSAIVLPILAAARQFGNMGEEILEAARKATVAVDVMSALAYAASQSGVSIQELSQGLKFMQRNLFHAAMGSDTARDAFRRAKISMDAMKLMGPAEQLLAIAQAFEHIQDPAKRAGLASAIFGREGVNMLKWMTDGSAAMRGMIKEAYDLGLVISETDALAAREFNRDLRRLGGTLKFMAATVGAAVVPAIMDMIKNILPTLGYIVKWIKQNKELVVLLLNVGVAISAVGAALIGIGGTIYAFGLAFKVLAALISVALIPFKILAFTFLSPLGLLIGVIGGLTYAFFSFTKEGQRAGKVWIDAWNNIAATAKKAWGGIVDAVAAGDLGLAAKIAWAGLKVAWYELIYALTYAWTEFTRNWLYIWNDATDGMAKILIRGWAGALNAIDSMWLASSNSIAKGLAAIWNLFRSADQQIDVGPEIEASERAQRERATRRKETTDRLIRNVEEDAKRRKEREGREAGAVKVAAPEGLADAKAELDRLTKEAADKRAEREAAAKAAALRANLGAGVAGLGGGGEAAGTFNPFAARGLVGGAESIFQKQVNLLEQIKDIQKNALNQLIQGGVFAR